jgi:hypothetical protein
LLQKGANGIRKEFSEVRRKNDGLTVIPLPQGLHTQHESAAASAPGSPKDMGLPHRPSVLEANSRRNECEVNRNWDEKI